MFPLSFFLSSVSLTRFDFGEGRGGSAERTSEALNSCTPKNTSFSGEISPISALSVCFVKIGS